MCLHWVSKRRDPTVELIALLSLSTEWLGCPSFFLKSVFVLIKKSLQCIVQKCITLCSHFWPRLIICCYVFKIPNLKKIFLKIKVVEIWRQSTLVLITVNPRESNQNEFGWPQKNKSWFPCKHKTHFLAFHRAAMNELAEVLLRGLKMRSWTNFAHLQFSLQMLCSVLKWFFYFFF